MTDNSVFKIKDSVDLFLSNGHYLMAYYMNTRQRKSFRVNEEMVHLLECIDGERNIQQITLIMQENWDVEAEYVREVIELLCKNRIITEISKEQNVLSQQEIQRYSRQINYFSEFLGSELAGIEAQKKLIQSRIIIFGCGSVGGDIALQLAMAGVGQLVLFDSDECEPADVARHMFYRTEYDKLPKVEALKQELLNINSKIVITTIRDEMKPSTDIDALIYNSDFVVNTLDEPYIGYTASKISRICMKYKIPHFIAGGFDAHLASTGELIIPYVTPCVECYASHFKTVLKDWKPKKHPVIRRYTEIGGLSSMSLFSSSYACIEIIKCIAGLVDINENYKIRGEFLFHDMSLQYLNVKRNPDCPICGGRSNEP